MIRILVKKSKTDSRLHQVIVEGHANFDQTGQDIVCSAVSALTIGAINSSEKILNIDLEPKQNPKNGGYLSWHIPTLEDEYADDRLQLLMNSMVESLLMIEQEYKLYLRMNIETS